MKVKIFSLLCVLFFICYSANGSMSQTNQVEVIKIYSQNKDYYLTSIPYDNVYPSTRGKTSVFKNGNDIPLYVLERGFDLAIAHYIDNFLGKYSRYLYLSNDGQTIIYLLPSEAEESTEGIKSINIYKNGKLFKSYTKTEITGCDKDKEDCRLIYSIDYTKYGEVVDIEKSELEKRKVFKEGVTEKEKFLNNYSVFCFDDIVYLIDSRKYVHLFDLNKGCHIKSDSFDNIYEEIKDKAGLNIYESTEYEAPHIWSYPKLSSGKDTYESLADYIGFKYVPNDEWIEVREKYGVYSFKLSCIISKEGRVDIEKIEVNGPLSKDKIIKFFKNNSFDGSFIPEVLGKWYLGDKFFFFRNIDKVTASKEKHQQIIEEEQAYKKRLMLESIDGIYIPKDLCECFIELDKFLSYADKNKIKELPKKSDVISYHFSLGMTLRNRWGLWSGSRLQAYFNNQGIYQPDDMSGAILDGYYYWLKSNRGACEDNRKDKDITSIIKDLAQTVINPAGDFSNQDRLIWKFKTDFEVNSTPAVSEGVVYFGSRDGHLYAIDGKTGQEKWRFETEYGPVYTSPFVSEGMVYLGGHDGYLYAIDIKAGSKKWRFETDGCVSSPVVANGVAYFGSIDSFFYAVDAKTGREKWKFKTGREIDGTPTVLEGVVYFGSKDGYFYAVDIKTGLEKWKFKTGAPIASPVIKDGVIYFGSNIFHSTNSVTGYLFAVDVKSGREKWRYTSGRVDTTPGISDEVVCYGSLDGHLYAVDIETGKEKWKFETGDWIKSSPALSKGVVYVGSDDGYLYSVDIKTGKKNWMFEIGAAVSSPTVSCGVIFVGSDDGYLYAVRE
jgi:outer membrane protein assembly factor BamB